MKFVVLNPNTNPGMTDAVAAQLARHLPGSARVVGCTAREGPPVIATRDSYAEGAVAALRLAARVPADTQGVLLACFGDPGLLALRGILPMPVVGLAEAAMCAAARCAEPFAIVTAGRPWGALLRECAHAYGVAEWLVDVYTLDATGADLVREPEAFRDELRALTRTAADAGARRIVFGGAAFAGLEMACDARLAVLDAVRASAERLILGCVGSGA